MASDNEESLARRLWANVHSESVVCLYTPFVVALAAGNLDPNTLRDCFSQGLDFIKCYAQSFEFVEKCAENDDDAMISVGHFNNLFLKLLEDYNSLVKRWGENYSKEYTVNPATVKCTNFVYGISTGKWASPSEKAKAGAYTLGAMMPHIQLYAFIGKELQSLLDANGSSHPFERWIDYYSCKHYQDFTLQAEDLLNKLSVILTAEDNEMLEKFYHQAMIHELEFFSVQPMVQKTVVPRLRKHNPSEYHLVVFSNFDITCSAIDSTITLAEIKNESAQDSALTLIGRKFSEDYRKCLAKILLTEEVEKFDYTDLEKALEPLTESRKGHYIRLIESGLLKGLNLEDIKRVAEGRLLRDGCISFFQSIIENENISATIHIISHCFCNDLIKSAFSSGGNLLETLNIHANELIFDEDSISTGGIVRKIKCTNDKVKCFENILLEKSGKNELIIYIGYSEADLLCLVKADIGIVFCPSGSSIIEIFGTHFGISFVPLFSGLVKKQKEMVEEGSSSCNWKGLSGILYTVSSWAEIHSFVLGL